VGSKYGKQQNFFSDTEHGCKMARFKVKVIQTDMEKHKKEFAVELVQDKYLEFGQTRFFSQAIKQAMDSKYGGSYHCISGKTFGSCITYRPGSFILLEINQITLLIFEAD
jgi:hypothetical protein